MNVVRRIGILFPLAVTLLLLTACPSQTNIGRINADPGRYRDKEVAITGRVTDSWGVLGQGAYQVDDGTGTIWVATSRGLPSRGTQVGVKGRVQTGISVGGRNFGTVLRETDRNTRTR